MLAKLLKFVIITRFSKPLLALVALVLAYNTIIRLLTSENSQTLPGAFQYYPVGFSAFFIVVSLLFGGLFVMKSDRDYLLTLPLSRAELTLSFFAAQFLGSGVSLLFVYGFYISAIGSLETTLILVMDVVLFALLMTSLGVVSNLLQSRTRTALAAVLGVWCLPALIGFPFTPVSMFTGSLVYGSLTLLCLTVILLPVALRELSQIELGSMRSLLRATSTEYKKNMSFSGKTPLAAIYSYHLSFLDLAGRINLAGTSGFKAARVKTSTVLIVSSMVAIVFWILAGLSPIARFPTRPAVGVLGLVMGIFVLVMMSQGAFANERGWLAFTAMDPATYIRHLLISRIVSALAILGPFAIVSLLLAYQGVEIGLNSAVVLLVTIPAASILMTYFIARLGAVQQIKEEGMMPGEFNVRQLVAILPTYVVIGLLVVSGLSLQSSFIIAIIMAILAIILLLSSSTWRGIAYRLTERGFI